MRNHLFQDCELRLVLEGHREKMQTAIRELSAERMNGATDEEIISHYISEYRIEPLTIYRDRAEAEEKETRVDVSGEHFIRDLRRPGPYMVPGSEIVVDVPFTGDANLLKCAPSTWSASGGPIGTVDKSSDCSGSIKMSLLLASDTGNADQFNNWIERELNTLAQYVGWINSDVEKFNQSLENHARQAVNFRRDQLKKRGELRDKISIPLRKNPDAASPEPIPMPKRIVKPLPRPREVEQEYGISSDDFEYILKVLRQGSGSFESTPGALAKLGEEDLRDLVLGQLNTHFDGGATGERFRKKGKTDICIEYENRAAFVAECKLWTGPKAFKEAIDQLLGYLTWRDTQTALIIWNKKNKNFAKLQDDFSSYFKEHPNFIQKLDAGHAGEWRARFRSASDEDREITIHMFLVDLTVD